MFAHLVIGISALSIIREEQTAIGKDLSVFSNSHFSKTCFIKIVIYYLLLADLTWHYLRNFLLVFSQLEELL